MIRRTLLSITLALLLGGCPAGNPLDPASGQLQPDPASGQLQPDPGSGQVQPDPASGQVQPDPGSGQVQPDPASGQVQPEADRLGVTDDLRMRCWELTDSEIRAYIMAVEGDRRNGWTYTEELNTALQGCIEGELFWFFTERTGCTDCLTGIIDQVYGY